MSWDLDLTWADNMYEANDGGTDWDTWAEIWAQAQVDYPDYPDKSPEPTELYAPHANYNQYKRYALVTAIRLGKTANKQTGTAQASSHWRASRHKGPGSAG